MLSPPRTGSPALIMSDTAIEIHGLSKAYRIGLKESRSDSLVGAAMAAIRAPWERWRGLRRMTSFGASEVDDLIWAVRDVSLNIRSGEVVGLVGRNGAGKSTLLKILARVTEPTRGRARIFGRVASLLEVGTGFHPDLTGRENVYLNGTILGMTRREVEGKFDQIVAFSGIEKFIDTPAKRYSSGMRVRLAFSVAAHLEPEILLIDEVLAVGDAEFQKKCLGKMSEVARAGRTVLFVSHNLGSVTQLCDRGVWIDKGTVKADGPVDDVLRTYMGALSDHTFDFFSEDYGLAIERVVVTDAEGRPTHRVGLGEDLRVEIAYDAKTPIKRPCFLLKVESAMGACFTANMVLDGRRPVSIEGRGVLRCRFKTVPLLPRSYTLLLGVKTANNDKIMSTREVASFTVSGDLRRCGFEGDILEASSRATPVVVPYEWEFADGQKASVALAAGSPPADRRGRGEVELVPGDSAVGHPQA